ncbi:BrnA antitoxin family protein [Candidatus Magnetaquicoccus inordinatus]|uniref:BrnA antitoxin family protein n=1 Tax=Candidatus Magnetaquicoccus inordinatus TaxID=2496818 RepID=UPI00102C3B2F|nr:BrnA antitoxin family protein [Candidatus Magnetaquicoccus inordinatus]
MANRKPLTDDDGEVRELLQDDLRVFHTIDSLPSALQRKLRGAQKSPTKERITIRLSRSVVDAFRATGSGWQSRIDDVLMQWVQSQ